LLEHILDRLSWTLGTSVPRRRGDRYTLGDLWPGVRRRLLKTSAAKEVAAIDATVVLRNLIGAHHNEWAQTISSAEASRFSDAVRALLAVAFCSECHSWLAPAASGTKAWDCACGATRLRLERT
jgi:hypothetical protein